MAKVLVTVPHMGWISVHNVFAVERMMRQDKHQVTVMRTKRVPYENNMNYFCKTIRENDYEYWINFDADNAPARDPLELIDLDLDIVGMPSPIANWQLSQTEPYFWSAFDWDESVYGFHPHDFNTGDSPLQECDAVGSGAMIVARRVAERAHGWFKRFGRE